MILPLLALLQAAQPAPAALTVRAGGRAVPVPTVAAGHGLTYRNIAALSSIPELTEFNIGHNIISRSVFVGLNQAVREMIEAIVQ
jgi:pyridoxine 5'-phosphate synthase PdxJ